MQRSILASARFHSTASRGGRFARDRAAQALSKSRPTRAKGKNGSVASSPAPRQSPAEAAHAAPFDRMDGKPRIKVVGVGGAGSNAVNNMIASQMEGVEFLVANTDAQALASSLASEKIHLGTNITDGLGAGADPKVGKIAAEDAFDEIRNSIANSNMVFVTGGMGGGTGTGAAPVVARIAKEMGILTIGVVSTPFRFEGPNRMKLAKHGLGELEGNVDTLIVVPNENLLAVSDAKTTLKDAFRHADTVLQEGVKGLTDLIIYPGLINVDFADVKTVISDSGRAIMGTGVAEGKDRAKHAALHALSNPLLGQVSLANANGLLVTISGGADFTLFEVDAAMEEIRNGVKEDVQIIFGTKYDPTMEGRISVAIIASGVEITGAPARPRPIASGTQIGNGSGKEAQSGDARGSESDGRRPSPAHATTVGNNEKKSSLFSRFFG